MVTPYIISKFCICDGYNNDDIKYIKVKPLFGAVLWSWPQGGNSPRQWGFPCEKTRESLN